MREELEAPWPVVVIGGGPAGLAAGLQLSRAGCKTLLLEADRLGGQARRLPRIENYPGFPGAVAGKRLMSRFLRQARGWGLTTRRAQVLALRLRPGGWTLKLRGGARVAAQAVLYCGGARWRALGLPGEGRLRGVYHAAFDEAPRFAGRTVAVVGGGEAAVHQAAALAARARRVYLLSRGPLKVHALLRARLAACRNVVPLQGWRVASLKGKRRLEAVDARGAGAPVRLPVDALFVLVGMLPAKLPGLRRGAPGIFVAGDARGERFRQVAVAAGDGVRQGMRCLSYLSRGGA